MGRYDLVDGSFVALEKSIRQTLYQLPDDTRVCSASFDARGLLQGTEWAWLTHTYPHRWCCH